MQNKSKQRDVELYRVSLLGLVVPLHTWCAGGCVLSEGKMYKVQRLDVFRASITNLNLHFAFFLLLFSNLWDCASILCVKQVSLRVSSRYLSRSWVSRLRSALSASSWNTNLSDWSRRSVTEAWSSRQVHS